MKDDATNEACIGETPDRRPGFGEDHADAENADPSDAELLAMFGIDEEGLEASIAEYKRGDWSRMRFGASIDGKPDPSAMP